MTLSVLIKGEMISVSAEQVLEFKTKAFEKGEKYLNLIQRSEFRKVAIHFWENSPDYFFVIPASSSGKYHWAKELGGLFDHVLMGMYCANELSVTFGLSEFDRDMAITAIAGHDCLKYGIDYDPRYFDMHPFLPRSYYSKAVSEWMHEYISNELFCAIERHMGNISDGSWTSVGRIKPETPLEHVVHLADFMASRSEIVMEGL